MEVDDLCGVSRRAAAKLPPSRGVPPTADCKWLPEALRYSSRCLSFLSTDLVVCLRVCSTIAWTTTLIARPCDRQMPIRRADSRNWRLDQIRSTRTASFFLFFPFWNLYYFLPLNFEIYPSSTDRRRSKMNRINEIKSEIRTNFAFRSVPSVIRRFRPRAKSSNSIDFRHFQ